MSRLLAKLRQAELDAKAMEHVAAAVEAGTPYDAPPDPTTPGDDWQRLRGIPAIGRGVRSTMPGTDPLAALLHKEDKRQRS